MKKLKDQIKKAPPNPGVYIFRNKGLILYVGKAANLKKRINQYFKNNPYGPFLKSIIKEAKNIEFRQTNSEIEALILESRLIKKLKPKYNIMLRDDKQYFYVEFTNEKFPKIFITHNPLAVNIGPFTDGMALKTTLRLLRRIFPFCTCKQKHNNFCLNYHIEKCLGYCCLKKPELITKKQELQIYKRNIKAVKEILSGKKDSLIKKLKKNLNGLAKNREFEKAIELRDKLTKLEKIFANAKIILNSKNGSEVKYGLEKFRRIEAYDVSNIQGKYAVGVMVVFENGKPNKKEYRKFKIYSKTESDDTGMLKEILNRRFNHPEWPYPDLIVVDGGKPQFNAAKTAAPKNIPIIAVAKNEKHIGQKIFTSDKKEQNANNFLIQIDAEAHRFAISFYRKLHRKRLLPKAAF